MDEKEKLLRKLKQLDRRDAKEGIPIYCVTLKDLPEKIFTDALQNTTNAIYAACGIRSAVTSSVMWLQGLAAVLGKEGQPVRLRLQQSDGVPMVEVTIHGVCNGIAVCNEDKAAFDTDPNDDSLDVKVEEALKTWEDKLRNLFSDN